MKFTKAFNFEPTPYEVGIQITAETYKHDEGGQLLADRGNQDLP